GVATESNHQIRAERRQRPPALGDASQRSAHRANPRGESRARKRGTRHYSIPEPMTSGELSADASRAKEHRVRIARAMPKCLSDGQGGKKMSWGVAHHQGDAESIGAR